MTTAPAFHPPATASCWAPDALAGVRLLVAGGCGGIGRELVAQATALGARVGVIDLPASIAAHPPSVPHWGCDARDAASIASAVDEAAQSLGGMDACVNLIGFMTPPCPLARTPVQTWDEVIRGNLDSAFYLSRAVLPHLHASPRGGHLVHTASGLGAWARPNYGGYGPAKAGLILLTRELALENAPRVRVNAVAPGAVDTAFLRGGTGRSDESAAPSVDPQAFGQLVPLGRIAVPADVVGPTIFLLTPASSYLTGQTIYINGGTYMP
jgi:3-oxoacyl-[acyl-carrier protein] reductase